ncbi:MAG: Rpn family recombination-promoting nuclease/putative transposase [Spirochaetia bacterium]|nr:Rpn family recombination-promoting nuclease/putative transposase [Spirochaetia bacterium]
MPDYHDIFWKLLFQRIDCAIEFFQFLLKEKSKLLELENLGIIQEIIYRKKKLLYDILYEIPIRNSNEKLYFLLEHKSRRSSDFEIQMMKYKQVIHKWQKKEFGRMYSIIPVLFYQGLDNWDPEKELEEERKLYNPILSENRQDILIFDLRKIDLLNVFGSLEMKAGMLLLKIIRYPWDEFIEGWSKVREILNSMEKTKRIDLEEEMLDYIFRSRTEENDFLEEAIMGKKVLTAYERALEEGELKKALETARKMLEKGFSISEIQDITGLMDDQLKENGIL